MKSMKPAEKVVICEVADSTSEKGLYLSTNKKEKPELGKVIAIGKGELPVKVKVGDTIVFQKYSENVIMVRGKEFNFIKFEHILAVL